MDLSVKDLAKKWNLSERTIRNYCANGKINGAYIKGKTWYIPNDVAKPNIKKVKKNSLKDILKREKNSNLKGGIYHRIQIDLTYNSNHIEGSKLTSEETRYIFETNTIGVQENVYNVDDIIETVNHFKCIDLVIDNIDKPLSKNFIKNLHLTLKSSTTDCKKDWFNVGDFKKLPNEVNGKATTRPENVDLEISNLIEVYNKKNEISIIDILDFHYSFESIHPFQDGNGRIGRLIMFKECLKNNIVPFIINERHKLFYYRGLNEWKNDQAYLRDTCLAAQDSFKEFLDYFGIEYN